MNKYNSNIQSEYPWNDRIFRSQPLKKYSQLKKLFITTHEKAEKISLRVINLSLIVRYFIILSNNSFYHEVS